jgi:superfamily I DNA and RNA helicase
MIELQAEIEKVSKAGFTLRFRVPTADELAKMRRIHRELSADERVRQRRAESGARTLIDAIISGGADFETLPADVREDLARLVQQDPTAGYGDDL